MPDSSGADASAAKSEASSKVIQAALEQGDVSKMYLNNPEYSKFDDNGVPTHDAAGVELNKTTYKKLKKDMEIAQKKLAKKK